MTDIVNAGCGGGKTLLCFSFLTGDLCLFGDENGQYRRRWAGLHLGGVGRQKGLVSGSPKLLKQAEEQKNGGGSL